MKIDWNTIPTVHLIGIGGIGMSAVARLLVQQGKKVSGTEDNQSTETLSELQNQGVEVSQDPSSLDLPPASCYIYSDAWLTKHPEIIEQARTRGVPCISYAETLGSLTEGYKVIAVAGTHGKTTTTAMLVDVLEDAGLDPTATVGSLRSKTQSNFRAGASNYFIVEADEYRRHFLYLNPFLLIITNIDTDHLDYFKDLQDIQSAFRELAHKVPNDGFIVCRPQDQNVVPVITGIQASVIDYGSYIDPTLPLKVLPLNTENAGAALAAAGCLGIDTARAHAVLSAFSGTWRRFEYKGTTRSGALVYDDYAHHPEEIAKTLESVRQTFPQKRLVVVFQPHLYSRTKALMNDFAKSFTVADEVIIAPIFAAREEDDPSVSHSVLAQKIAQQGIQVQSLNSFDDIVAYLSEHGGAEDVVITMGAGDIYTVGNRLIV